MSVEIEVATTSTHLKKNGPRNFMHIDMALDKKSRLERNPYISIEMLNGVDTRYVHKVS